MGCCSHSVLPDPKDRDSPGQAVCLSWGGQHQGEGRLCSVNSHHVADTNAHRVSHIIFLNLGFMKVSSWPRPHGNVECCSSLPGMSLSVFSCLQATLGLPPISALLHPRAQSRQLSRSRASGCLVLRVWDPPPPEAS